MLCLSVVAVPGPVASQVKLFGHVHLPAGDSTLLFSTTTVFI